MNRVRIEKNSDFEDHVDLHDAVVVGVEMEMVENTYRLTVRLWLRPDFNQSKYLDIEMEKLIYHTMCYDSRYDFNLLYESVAVTGLSGGVVKIDLRAESNWEDGREAMTAACREMYMTTRNE